MRLSAVDLACHRGGRDVFAGLGFAVASGEVLTVTGRNGAGKSSLLRTIVGLVRIAHGKLMLEGGDPELTIARYQSYALMTPAEDIRRFDDRKMNLVGRIDSHAWTTVLNSRV